MSWTIQVCGAEWIPAETLALLKVPDPNESGCHLSINLEKLPVMREISGNGHDDDIP